MIRRAETRDLEGIMELLVQVNNVHAEGRPDLFIADTTKYDIPELEEIISNENTPVFVNVGESGELKGYCFCILHDYTDDGHMSPIKTLYIDDLCVDGKFRGTHAGSELYRYVRNYAKKIGCYNLTLNVWSCNPSAMRFYERMGLVPQKIGMEQIL